MGPVPGAEAEAAKEKVGGGEARTARMPRRRAGHRFYRAGRVTFLRPRHDLPNSRQIEPESPVPREKPLNKQPKLRTLGALRHHLSPPHDISVYWAESYLLCSLSSDGAGSVSRKVVNSKSIYPAFYFSITVTSCTVNALCVT
uniref:Uncharacterized protein n=1 Tax=Pipistrellus kuhlii TaxID=59472 RepID=A0A7J7SGA2_PIPKU|nr:hypothetical protein mPipKuh1_009959 [Pipistrellus kuhlii]